MTSPCDPVCGHTWSPHQPRPLGSPYIAAPTIGSSATMTIISRTSPYMIASWSPSWALWFRELTPQEKLMFSPGEHFQSLARCCPPPPPLHRGILPGHGHHLHRLHGPLCSLPLASTTTATIPIAIYLPSSKWTLIGFPENSLPSNWSRAVLAAGSSNDTSASPMSLPVSVCMQINHRLSHFLTCLHNTHLLEVISHRRNCNILTQALHKDGVGV